MSNLFNFPNPVDENAARLVALGVVIMSVVTMAADQHWMLFLIAYGFVARVLAGPRFSPLGRLVTQVAIPALGRPPKRVPGPPKRFAQGMGVVFSVSSLGLWLAGATTAADLVLGALVIAASLEAFLGLCLGCLIFGQLMKAGVIPESACEACNNVLAS